MAESTPAQASANSGAKLAIHYLTAEGWPLVLELTAASGTAAIAASAAAIKALQALGCTPATPAVQAEHRAEQTQAAPICQYHGAMSPSAKAPGTFYCKAKMGSGEYCRQRFPA